MVGREFPEMDDVTVAELKDVKENAPRVKIRKPSRRELYEDAARILEELFAKQLEDQLAHHPHRRTDPLPSQVVQVPQWECCDSPSSPIPQSTSTESCHDSGNKSSSMHFLVSAHENYSTSSKNVLDYPGEDIPFMDDDGRIRSRHASGNDKRLSTIFFQIPPPIVTVDSVYSNIGTTSPIHPPPPPPSAVGSANSDISDGAGGSASSEVPFDNKTHEEKEKLYPKIAQRVFTIADGQQEEVDLEKLEKEIIECLRGKGDELSHKIDGPAEKLVEQTKAHTYERFERTIQHSLGNEVSWNHLALLFYSTRAVVKAVGLSSDAAREVTEMTLKYFGEKFSSWIINQGGFETLAESASELD